MTAPAKELARRKVLCARLNLNLAREWTHVTPSERSAAVQRCNDELNDALEEWMRA